MKSKVVTDLAAVPYRAWAIPVSFIGLGYLKVFRRDADPIRNARVRRLAVDLGDIMKVPAPNILVVKPKGRLTQFSKDHPFSRRYVVLDSDVVDGLDAGALRCVVAHELSHVHHGDSRRGNLLVAVAAVTMATLAVMPVLPAAIALTLVAAELAAVPVIYRKGFKSEAVAQRSVELRADRESARVTRRPPDVVRSFHQLDAIVAERGYRVPAQPESIDLSTHPTSEVRTAQMGEMQRRLIAEGPAPFSPELS